MKVKPIREYVLIRRLESESKTSGGLIIPDTAKEKPVQGIVIGVGEGKIDNNGQLVKPVVKEGDKVLFTKWSGTEVKVDGESLVVMKECDIIALIED
jgi:chaperonin GroES